VFETIAENPMFPLALSFLCFEVGVAIQNRVKSTLANPLLICAGLVIAFLKVFGISYETYNNGARFISLFLAPCTALLAVNIYANLATIKKYLLPILCGTAAAAASSMGCVYLLCRVFGLDQTIMLSLLPKSVTAAIAMPLVKMTGGLDSLIVVATVTTGVLCAVIAPWLLRIFRLKDPVAVGIAMGASGHAMGTATAMKMGSVQGATSAIAIGMSGLFTVLFYSILFA